MASVVCLPVFPPETDCSPDTVSCVLPSFEVPKALDKNPTRRFRAWRIPGTEWTLVGYSRCRDKTFFYIPQLSVALDGGYCRGRLAEHLFLTHGHSDHSYDIGYMCTQQFAMTVHCPAEIQKHISDYCKVFVELNACKTLPTEPQWHFTIHGVKPGDVIVPKRPKAAQQCDSKVEEAFESKSEELADGRSKKKQKKKKVKKWPLSEVVVTVFECIHSVPCVGYMFESKVQRRKEEFKEVCKKEDFIALRKAGVSITETLLQKRFAYVGDTGIAVFDRNPKLLQFPVVIIECTFLYTQPATERRVARDGHIIWSQLKAYVLQNPTTTFVLIHFSCRHSEQQIVDFFKAEELEINQQLATTHSLKNVVLWACQQTDGTQKVSL